MKRPPTRETRLRNTASAGSTKTAVARQRLRQGPRMVSKGRRSGERGLRSSPSAGSAKTAAASRKSTPRTSPGTRRPPTRLQEPSRRWRASRPARRPSNTRWESAIITDAESRRTTPRPSPGTRRPPTRETRLRNTASAGSTKTAGASIRIPLRPSPGTRRLQIRETRLRNAGINSLGNRPRRWCARPRGTACCADGLLFFGGTVYQNG